MSKIRAYGIWPWLWEIDIITLCNANFAFLVTLSAISLWFMWTIKKSTKARKSSLPPGPRGLPLVGYLPFLGTNLVEVLPELAKLYGPIYKLWLGQKLCVVISSPSLVKEVVREKDTIFGNHDATIAAKMSSYGGNDIAFTPYGHEWRKLRKVFAHDMVGNASLERTRNLRRKEVTKIIRDVYKNAGKATDFGELAFTISINTMISMLWGGKVEGAEVVANKEAEFREIFANLTRLLGSPNVSDVFPSLARFDIQGIGRQIKEIAAWFEEFLNALIDARTNSFDAVKEEEDGNGGEKDFLQILLELIGKEDNASSITMDQLKAILMDILVGGTDTTPTVAEWAMAELILHPEMMERVKKELNDVVGLNNMVEEVHLPKLCYLWAVIKETFRLHPAFPFLVPRISSLSTTIGGYFIPKGTQVIMNYWSIHKDPQFWDNPLEFRPERFFEAPPGKFDFHGNDFQYMPFGSGRRMCAGLPLAEKMVPMILASLLHSFEWKLPHDAAQEDLSGKFGLVMKKTKSLVVIPTPRLSNLQVYK